MVKYNLDMKEIWKPVPQWEDLYQVSDLGRVASLGGRVGSSTLRKILIPRKKKDGYSMFRVSRNGKQSELNLHRTVAKIFIPNPDNKKEVNHKNGIRDDNRVKNLEWVTPRENQRHAIARRGDWRKGRNGGISKFNMPIGITSTKEGKKEYMREYFKTYKRKDR